MTASQIQVDSGALQAWLDELAAEPSPIVTIIQEQANAS